MRNKHFNPETHETDLLVSEAGGDHQGSHSPFGEVEFPLPADELHYQHPSAADRPRLAALAREEAEAESEVGVEAEAGRGEEAATAEAAG